MQEVVVAARPAESPMGLSKSANIEKKERGSRGSSGGGQGANGVRLKGIRLLLSVSGLHSARACFK